MKNKQNEILFITFSNTVTEMKGVLKKVTDFPITVRANDSTLAQEIEKIIGRDRPRAIIYDGNFPNNHFLKNETEWISTCIHTSDVDCKIYSYEKLFDIPGVAILTGEELKALCEEPD